MIFFVISGPWVFPGPNSGTMLPCVPLNLCGPEGGHVTLGPRLSDALWQTTSQLGSCQEKVQYCFLKSWIFFPSLYCLLINISRIIYHTKGQWCLFFFLFCYYWCYGNCKSALLQFITSSYKYMNEENIARKLGVLALCFGVKVPINIKLKAISA